MHIDVELVVKDLEIYRPDVVIEKYNFPSAKEMYNFIRKQRPQGLRRRRSFEERKALIEDFNKGVEMEKLLEKFGYKNEFSLKTQLYIISGLQRHGSDLHQKLPKIIFPPTDRRKYNASDILESFESGQLSYLQIKEKFGFPTKKAVYKYITKYRKLAAQS
jgi:hypothetical protein